MIWFSLTALNMKEISFLFRALMLWGPGDSLGDGWMSRSHGWNIQELVMENGRWGGKCCDRRITGGVGKTMCSIQCGQTTCPYVTTDIPNHVKRRGRLTSFQLNSAVFSTSLRFSRFAGR